MHLCQYSSLCPASRTWCSRRKPLLSLSHSTLHTQKHIFNTCTGTLWYESVERLEKLESLCRFLSLQPPSPLQKRISWFQLWLIISCLHIVLLFTDNEELILKKKFPSWVRELFSQPKHFSAKDQEEKKYKSQELQYTRIAFLFNKHFMRNQTLIACGSWSQGHVLYFNFYFCVQYKVCGFLFWIGNTLIKKQQNIYNISKGNFFRKFGQQFRFHTHNIRPRDFVSD